ncbi:MAG: GNAT family N-acetyltransferase [Thermoleophilia bacterium]
MAGGGWRAAHRAVGPRLASPAASCHRSFLVALNEYHSEGLLHRKLPAELLRDPAEFARYVAALRADAETPGEAFAYVTRLIGTQPYAPPSDGWVPQTILWWLHGDEYLGRLNIRHRLSRDLRRRGGHIGYEVRPGARRQGHATAMLAAVLPLAAELGINPARVDCAISNVASRRVIEKNGGILVEERDSSLHFRVPTA